MKRVVFFSTALAAAVVLLCCCSRTNMGIIAHWPAEGNGKDTVSGHDATLANVAFAPGAMGQGFRLKTPDSRIAVPTAPEFNFGPGEDFSITAWIMPLPAETSFDVMDIVDKRRTGNILGAVGYALCLDGGRLSCQLAAGPYRQMKFSSFTSPGPRLLDGKFHHVALSVKRNSTSGGALYVDGARVLTFDPTPQKGDLSNDEPLLIGTHPDPAMNAGFTGVIDEVRLYRRAISQDEVNLLARIPSRH